jgi:hypothetical protein
LKKKDERIVEKDEDVSVKKINKIVIDSINKIFEVHITIEEKDRLPGKKYDLTPRKKYYLQFNESLKSNQYELTIFVALWMYNSKEIKCRISDDDIKEQLKINGYDVYKKNIYDKWKELSSASKICKGGKFTIYEKKVKGKLTNPVIDEEDFKLQFAEKLFRHDKTSFLWLGDCKKPNIEFNPALSEKAIRELTLVLQEEQSWVHKYKTELLKELNDEVIFKENKFIKIDIAQKLENKSEYQSQDQEKYQDIKDFITHVNSAHSLILLGEVGAGKTTTLRHYLIKCLENLKPDDANSIIPVFIPLKRYKKYHDITSLVMVAVNEHIDILPLNKVTFDIGSYNFCFIFDGLDEVPYEFRDDAVDDLKSVLNQKNKVIISCRLKDYDDNFNNINNYRLKELTDDQIKKHLERFLDKDAFAIFMQEIKQEQNIHDMAKNPFLLDIMIDIMKSDLKKNLPPNKGELIEKYVKIIIKKSHKDKINIPNIKKDTRDIFLGLLAFYMTDEGTLTCDSVDDRFSIREKWLSIRDQLDSEDKIETILKKAEIERLLKSGSSDGDIEFMNPLIKDHFASYYIKSIYYERNKNIKEKIEELTPLSKWEDVILILVGIVDKETSNNIINILIKINPFYAAKCFSMAQELSSITKDNLIKTLDDIGKSSRNDISKVIFALNDIGTDAVIEPLTNILTNRCRDFIHFNLTINYISRINQVKAESILINLLKSKDQTLLCNAIFAIGRLECNNVKNLLIDLIKVEKDPDVIYQVALSLGDLNATEAIPSLIDLIKVEKDPNVLIAVVRALGDLKARKAIIPIIYSLKEAVGPTIYRLTQNEAIVPITYSPKKLIDSYDKKVLRSKRVLFHRVLKTLNKIDLDKAVKLIIKLLDESVLHNALKAPIKEVKMNKTARLYCTINTEEIVSRVIFLGNAIDALHQLASFLKSKSIISNIVESLIEFTSICELPYLLRIIDMTLNNLGSRMMVYPLIKSYAKVKHDYPGKGATILSLLLNGLPKINTKTDFKEFELMINKNNDNEILHEISYTLSIISRFPKESEVKKSIIVLKKMYDKLNYSEG